MITEQQATEQFAKHELTIRHDDGLYRHLRVQQPGTWTYGFDVVTWPGYLCICGDIGTWTFARVPDMFEFFESDSGRINPDYWQQKLTDDPDRARWREWGHDEEFDVEGFVDKGFNAMFLYACYGVVLAISLYREATK